MKTRCGGDSAWDLSDEVARIRKPASRAAQMCGGTPDAAYEEAVGECRRHPPMDEAISRFWSQLSWYENPLSSENGELVHFAFGRALGPYG